MAEGGLDWRSGLPHIWIFFDDFIPCLSAVIEVNVVGVFIWTILLSIARYIKMSMVYGRKSVIKMSGVVAWSSAPVEVNAMHARVQIVRNRSTLSCYNFYENKMLTQAVYLTVRSIFI